MRQERQPPNGPPEAGAAASPSTPTPAPAPARGLGPRAGRRARAAIAALVAAVLLAVAGCGSDGGGADPAGTTTTAPAGADAAPVAEPRWESCGEGMECARLPVPLDHAVPDGEAIELALVRIPAAEPEERIGSLVVNPGGPGGSGVGYVQAAGPGFGETVRDRFDIVGFDPRGVGASAAVRCQTDEEKDRELAAADVVPENGAELEELRGGARRFAEGCGRANAKLLPHLSTDAAARDLDLLRAALGDDKLTYLGISYGSVLGATYASLFPGRVRAMTLDAAVDPTVWINQPDETITRQAAGFEAAFNDFLADCQARGEACGFGDGDPGAAYDRLVQRLDDDPITAKASGDPRPVNAYVAFLAVNRTLYDRSIWPQLGDALELADEEDDGSALLELADELNGRQPDGSYENLNDANASINCADEVNATDPAAYDRLSEQLGRASPRFGRAFAYARLVCAFWPAEAASRYTGPFRAEGAPPILVVGTTGDPAAPYAWAQSLAGQLASGVLLTFRGVTHGAYGFDECVNRAVDRYLVEVTPPRDGTTCP